MSRAVARRVLATTTIVTLAACAGAPTKSVAVAARASQEMEDAPRLHSEELGAAGPTVVFLPGIGGTTSYYRDRVLPLAADHRLVLVDLLGFGRSPKPRVRYDLERHVAELRRVLAGRGRLTIVGHSLGARVAVAYAARYPEDVERLVLVSLPHFESRSEALAQVRRGGWRRRVIASRQLAPVGRVVANGLPRAVVRQLAPELPADVVLGTRMASTRALTSSLWDAVLEHDLGAEIDRVPGRIPVTLLHGDADGTAPLAGAEAAVVRRPDWELRVLPGVDHHPLLRDAESVLRAAAGARPALRLEGSHRITAGL